MAELCEEIWTMFFEHVGACEGCSKRFNEMLQQIIDPLMKAVSGAAQDATKAFEIGLLVDKENSNGKK